MRQNYIVGTNASETDNQKGMGPDPPRRANYAGKGRTVWPARCAGTRLGSGESLPGDRHQCSDSGSCRQLDVRRRAARRIHSKTAGHFANVTKRVERSSCSDSQPRSIRSSSRRIAEAGHAIGNHTWDHPSFPLISGRERQRQLKACADAIAPYGLRLFRPPYGEQNLRSRLTAASARIPSDHV